MSDARSEDEPLTEARRDIAGEERAVDANGEPTAPTAPPAAVGPAVSVGEASFERRHPNALRLELAVGGGVVAVTTLLALGVTTVLTVVAGAPAALLLIAAALPVLLAFPFLVVPRWRHQRYLYRADDRGLEIRQGVWWRSHRFIPRTRLQHTDVAQGPLQRQFDLADLVVHTAGTHEARTTVSGLSLTTARALRDRLTDEEPGESGAEDDGV